MLISIFQLLELADITSKISTTATHINIVSNKMPKISNHIKLQNQGMLVHNLSSTRDKICIYHVPGVIFYFKYFIL
jgi:hypothetical protein